MIDKKKIARDITIQLKCVSRLLLTLQDDVGDLCVGEKDGSELDRNHDLIVNLEFSVNVLRLFFLKYSERDES